MAFLEEGRLSTCRYLLDRGGYGVLRDGSYVLISSSMHSIMTYFNGGIISPVQSQYWQRRHDFRIRKTVHGASPGHTSRHVFRSGPETGTGTGADVLDVLL